MNNIEVTAKVAAFFSQKPVRSYKKGDMIFMPGDEITDVYYVQTGFIRLYSMLADGKELTLNIFKPGTYFPIFLIFNSISNPHYFQAMTPTKLSKIPKGEILRFIKNEPDVLMDFTTRLSRGLQGLINNIQYSLFGSVHTKLISTLLLLAKRFGEPLPDGAVLIPIRLTHQDVANIIGVARETASLEIIKLTQKHLISDKRRKIIILNVPRLEQEALMDDDTQTGDYSL
jgi:CRP-like cAMP-binding protein